MDKAEILPRLGVLAPPLKALIRSLRAATWKVRQTGNWGEVGPKLPTDGILRGQQVRDGGMDGRPDSGMSDPGLVSRKL